MRSNVEKNILIPIFIILFFFFGFHLHFNEPPIGIHFYRQVDSLSFCYGYVYNGYRFFQPQLFNLVSQDGKAASEFPLIYYVSSFFFPFFKSPFFILKLFNLIVVYTGIYLFYNSIKTILKDWIYALLISLFLFTSTVFNFYSFNFLPDSAALGFVLIGWHFYLKNESKKTCFLAVLFFTLAGLTKIPFSIGILTIFGISIFRILFRQNEGEISKNKITFSGSLLGILIIFLWTIYTIYYNQKFGSKAFISTIYPIWEMSNRNIAIVWLHITDYWYTRYFAHSSYHLLFTILVFQLLRIKKSSEVILLSITLTFLGTLSFVLLFFNQFQDHDYCALILVPFVLFLLLNGISIFQKTVTNNKIHVFAKLLFGAIVAIGINYSRMKLPERYQSNQDEMHSAANVITKNKKALDELGIPENAKIIIASDETLNGGLLFMNRKGWTLKKREILDKNYLKTKITEGASYFLFINRTEYKTQFGKSLQLIMNKKNIQVYKIQ